MSDPSDVSILVCDDTAAKRYVIASWLRRSGYTVVEAETGSQALARLSSQPVDLAVLDVHLPDMSGLDVCARIKADPRTASTPVVHISAVAVDTHDRTTGLDRGADAYLVDPIEPREMLATVRSLLRSSGARRSAEQLATRLDRLAAASLRINVALVPERLAAATAAGATHVLGTESVVVLLPEGDDGVVARSSADRVVETATVPREQVNRLLEVAGSTRVVAADQAPFDEVLSHGHADQWALQEMHSGMAVVGLVAVPQEGQTTAEDQSLLLRIAQASSVALGNLRVFEEEHRTTLTLQRSLLPASLPPLEGLDVAARYRASGRQVEIGGDFFDAFATDQGMRIVAIGDVQGHSLEAALVMAELRYSLRAYLHDQHTAPEALSLLNDMLLRSHPEMTATVCVLSFSTDGSTMSVANAGHIPPLVVQAGVAAYLEPGGTLLGIDGWQVTPQTVALVPGDRVLLMTDGLVERRGSTIGTAMDDIEAEVVAEVTADRLCDILIGRWGDSEDDVCLIVLDVLDG